MFSEKKVWRVEIQFVERNRGDLASVLAISECGKNKGQNTAIGSCRSFIEDKHWGKNFVCASIFYG